MKSCTAVRPDPLGLEEGGRVSLGDRRVDGGFTLIVFRVASRWARLDGGDDAALPASAG
jgi:hypothetical protein